MALTGLQSVYKTLFQWRRPADKTNVPAEIGTIIFPISFSNLCASITEMTNDDEYEVADCTNYRSISNSSVELLFGSNYQPSLIMIGF